MTERTERTVFIIAAVLVIAMNIAMAVMNTWQREKKETPQEQVEVTTHYVIP